MTLIVHQFPCLTDNYGFLVHEPVSGQTACIDTPEPARILGEADAKGWRISQIWNTHWHPDHAGGNAAVAEATGCVILAPEAERARIGHADRWLVDGDTVRLGEVEVAVLATPGHTLGHIIFHAASAGVAFVGDTVFGLGCGRLFEGTPAMMWQSLSRIAALPSETTLYCAHEYTAANARYALHAMPMDARLAAYAEEVATRRASGEPTVPLSLARELACNPFLRAGDAEMQAHVGTAGDAVATFAALRAGKGSFRS
jgi:hydroxyacylglutathione hydrolase